MKVDNINALALAYLGDSIYEFFIRNYLLEKGIVLKDTREGTIFEVTK